MKIKLIKDIPIAPRFKMVAEKIRGACPFCGGDILDVPGHEVECKYCHATGPCLYPPVPDRDTATAAWNRGAGTRGTESYNTQYAQTQ